MTCLLSLEAVSKRHCSRGREFVALRDVDFELEAGELVGVWDTSRAGATALLRVAAGLDQPDAGVVRFEGRNLASDRGPMESGALRYADAHFELGLGDTTISQLQVPLLAGRGVSLLDASARAEDALNRVGATACANVAPGELSAEELARVRIARALVLGPKLLVIDQPASAVDLGARDDILALLRSIADEGTAVLMTVPEPKQLAGVDRAMQVNNGRLIGKHLPEVASVVPLRRSGARAASSQ
jgi:putative ABC transport system ATP-binding protein